jgi:hypothetical protein
MIDFLNNRRQIVIIDGVTTEFLDINHGVPHGTALGPVMFTKMVNYIKAVNLSNDLLAWEQALKLNGEPATMTNEFEYLRLKS